MMVRSTCKSSSSVQLPARARLPGIWAVWALVVLSAGAVPATAAPPEPPGAVDPAVARILAQLEQIRGPQGYTLLRELWQLWEQTDPIQIEEALAAVAGDGAAARPLRAYAEILRAYARRRRGDLASSKRLIRQLGYLDEWFVVGPFDNDSKDGLTRAFVPEQELREPLLLQDRSFDGKERPVRWRLAPDVHHYGWLDLGAMLRPQQQICAFATTYLRRTGEPAKAPAPEQIQLWIGAAGAFKLFWNDAEVLQDAGYRDLDPDRFAVSVPLHPGYNRLTVKICSDEQSPAVAVRVADDRGAPLPDLEVAATPAASTAAATGMRRRLVPEAPGTEPQATAKPPATAGGAAGPVQQLEALLSDKSDDAQVMEDYARYLLITGGEARPGHRGRDLARRAAEAAPTVRRLLLAAQLAEDRNQRRGWLDQAEAAVTASTPLHERLELMLAQASLARTGPNWREAVPIYERILELRPDSIQAILGKVDLYVEAGLQRSALSLLEHKSRGRPHSVAYARALAAQYRTLGRDTEAAEAESQYAALRFDDGGFLKDQLDLAVQRRDLTGARRWAERLGASDPASTWAHGVVAGALRSLGDAEGALRAYERARRIAPEDISTLQALADLHGELAQRPQQLSYLKQILRLRPQSKAVRAYLEHIEPTTAPEDEKYAWEPAQFLARRVISDDKHSRRLLRKLMVTTVFDNGLSSSFHQVVFQPLTNEAAAQSRQYAFTYHADRQIVQLRSAKVFRKDGRIDEAIESGSVNVNDPSINMYTLQRTFYVQLPRLSVGDVVELRYRIEDVAAQNEMADYFAEIEYLQSDEPIDSLEYVLIAPKTKRLHMSTSPLPGLGRSVTEQGDNRIYRFTASAVPALEDEPLMPAPGELLAHVHVSSFPSWKDVGRFYWGLSRDKLAADDEVRRRAQQLVKGLRTDREKVAAIYRYAATETRYVALELGIEGIRPRPAALTLARGWGDCKDKATLIISMLGAVGIEASIVLVRTGLRGDFDTATASLAPFDHAIVYVPALDLYLDGTAEATGTQELPSLDRAALALRIDQGDAKLVRLPDPEADQSWQRRRFVLRPKGLDSTELRFEALLETQGVEAPGWRQRYHSKLTRRERAASALGGSLGPVELSAGPRGLRLSDVEDVEQPIRLELQGTASAELEGARLSVPMGPSWKLTAQLAARAKRRNDLLIGPKSKHEEEWVLHLPAGAQVVASPQPVKLTSRFGTFELAVEQAARQITVRTSLVLQQSRIPAKDYAAWRAFCKSVDSGAHPRVVLSK